jgi:hypothetical protein
MGKIQSARFVSMILAVIYGAYFAQDLQDEQFVFLIAFGLIFHVVELLLFFFVKNPNNYGFIVKTHLLR